MSPGVPLRRVIVTADDFGASAAVNEAVLRAHREGILTTASLMVTGAAAAEAVALARATPTLAVGLHLALADAPSALPPQEIPHLIGADGLLERDPMRAWLALSRRAARAEADREIAAQFDRFAATGLALSHVDGHHHLHVHPAAFPTVAALAERFGARGVRLPWEGLRTLWTASPRRAALDGVVLGALALRWRGLARRRSLRFTARVHGILRSGAMHAPYLRALLSGLPPGTAELFLHPSTAAADGRRGPNPGDLAALLDPGVRALAAERAALATYATLETP